MKTRTLLLLSVGTALAILVAGGVLLFQLSNESGALTAVDLGASVTVGDVTITVVDAVAATDDRGLLGVDVEIGGVDDPDGLDTIRLVTGDRTLAPIAAVDDGRCTAITVAVQECRLDFDVSGSETSSRVLVMRRGDEQVNWRLPAP
jgi:hypothetical protein